MKRHLAGRRFKDDDRVMGAMEEFLKNQHSHLFEGDPDTWGALGKVCIVMR